MLFLTYNDTTFYRDRQEGWIIYILPQRKQDKANGNKSTTGVVKKTRIGIIQFLSPLFLMSNNSETAVVTMLYGRVYGFPQKSPAFSLNQAATGGPKYKPRKSCNTASTQRYLKLYF